MRGAARVPWQSCLPESVRGEACACKNSREGGVQTSVALASTVLLGCQKRGGCTLGQLMSPRFESVFFASFLCRFGQRNDVPPRTVANSDKENSSLKQTTKLSSNNPALTPTATVRTWQPEPHPQPLTLTTPPISANARRLIGPQHYRRQRRQSQLRRPLPPMTRNILGVNHAPIPHIRSAIHRRIRIHNLTPLPTLW